MVGAGPHGSGLTARLAVGEGGNGLESGVADVMDNGWVGTVDKVVPGETVMLAVGLAVGPADDFRVVLVTGVAKGVVIEPVADVIEASSVGNGVKVTGGLVPESIRIYQKSSKRRA